MLGCCVTCQTRAPVFTSVEVLISPGHCRPLSLMGSILTVQPRFENCGLLLDITPLFRIKSSLLERAMPADEIEFEAEELMDKAVGFLRDEMKTVRTGRASPGLIEHLRVPIEAYGST